MFAMDRHWWTGTRTWHKGYLQDVMQKFAGEKYTTTHGIHGIRTLEKRDFEHYGNSGAAAISLAAWFGAARIVMIGYDCRKTTKSHWHGDHPKGMGNAGTVGQWPDKFRKLAAKLGRSVEVINCTPGTALRCFAVGELDQCLK